MTQSFIVGGDVGGTRARYALATADGRRIVFQETLESRTFGTFEDGLARFLEHAQAHARAKLAIKGKSGLRVLAASFGIAGPVVDQRVKTTNLPWTIDARVVAKKFRIPCVTLLNDLVAVGLGALVAAPSKVRVVQNGRPAKKGGNVAVISAGTGLGEASFMWNGTTHVACPSEGGHCDFAPQSKLEVALWESLHRAHGHVSYERICSGSTIGALYTFMVEEQRVPESKSNAAYVAKAKDHNVAVVELAEQGKSEAAMQAIELWARVYGAETGNLALKALSTSGVYICGGASAHLANVILSGFPKRKKKGSPFLEGFLDKGRLRPLLEKMPVALCLEPMAGLLGAVAHSARSARS